MSRDHIIPQFILRGFAINPTAAKSKQKIMIYDRKTKKIKTEKIADAYAIQDFNSPETEKFLAQKYENDIAKIFQQIKDAAEGEQKAIHLSNKEYKLLYRFFVIMWRRNDIQEQKMKKLSMQVNEFIRNLFGDKKYKEMLLPEYRNVPIEQEIEQRINEVKQSFYDRIIQETNDDDPTAQKTIKHYKPHIIYNKSNIHFILHNSYATLEYFVKDNTIQEDDIPYYFIEPISNKPSFCLLFSENEIELTKENYEISIEVITDDDFIKNHFVKEYITSVATSIVVDDTNKEYVK